MKNNSETPGQDHITSDPYEIIDQIYEGWEYIGKDENGNDYRLPLRKRVIDSSKQLLARLKSIGSDDENIKAHYAYIRKVLRNSLKRKMIVSWKFVLIVLGFLAFLVWQSDVYKPAGHWVTDLTPEELLARQKMEIAMYSNHIDDYINKEIPETNAKIENLKQLEKTGENAEELKKSKDWLKSLNQLLEDDRARLEAIKDITPESFRELTITKAKKDNASMIGGFIIWGVALLLYFISQRKPYFMFWRKSYNNGNLSFMDDAGAAVVSASLMDSLVNFDSNSTEYVQWSDGTVTRETDLTKGGMNIIFAIVILMFYIMIMVISLPLRVVIGFLRNYILYI